MGNLAPGFEDRVCVYGKAMVLGCDLDSTCFGIEYGLICASVSEFEFIGLCSGCECQELVSEADAEDGHWCLVVEDCADGLDGVFDGCGVTWAVGDE